MDIDMENYTLRNLKVQNFEVILQYLKECYEGFVEVFIFHEGFIQFLSYCKRDDSFNS